MGRAAWGVRHGACGSRRACRRARSTTGPPGWVPLCCRSTSCSRSRATCKSGAVQRSRAAARLAATLGRAASLAALCRGTDRRAACRGAIERAVWSGATERRTGDGASERAATAALAGGRRAEAVGRAKPGLSSRSTLTVLDRGTAAAGPEGAGARRSAAAEAIELARGLWPPTRTTEGCTFTTISGLWPGSCRSRFRSAAAYADSERRAGVRRGMPRGGGALVGGMP